MNRALPVLDTAPHVVSATFVQNRYLAVPMETRGLTAAFVVNYFLAKAAGVSTATFWAGLEAWRWMYLIGVLPALATFWKKN